MTGGRSPRRLAIRAAGAGRRGAVLTLLAVLAPCLVLGIVGLGVEGKLEPTSLIVSGTSSARGQDLAERSFGPSSPFTILLRGPAAALEGQGPALVADLRRSPHATVLSPWDRGAVAALRPGPRKALVLADFHVAPAEAMRTTVPQLERVLAARVRPPVVAVQSGYASVSRALQEESLSATERAELIAAPLLLLFLLLVFRSVVAGRSRSPWARSPSSPGAGPSSWSAR